MNIEKLVNFIFIIIIILILIFILNIKNPKYIGYYDYDIKYIDPNKSDAIITDRKNGRKWNANYGAGVTADLCDGFISEHYGMSCIDQKCGNGHGFEQFAEGDIFDLPQVETSRTCDILCKHAIQIDGLGNNHTFLKQLGASYV